MPELFHNSEQAKGIALLVITAVIWSTSGFGIKWVDWNPLAIAGARSGIAAIVIWAAFRQSTLHWNRPMVYGGVAYAIMMLTFVVANKLTTAANAILLQYTSPIYVAVLSALFLQEKPRFYDWLTIGFVGGGIILFFQDQMTAGSFVGNVLAIASGISMAIMIVSMRMQKAGSPFGSVLVGNILTCLCGLPFFFEGGPGVNGWVVLFLLGSIQTGMSYVLYSLAIKRVSALEAAIITVIEPILNPIWVFLLVGEGPGSWALVGGIIILLAITARCVLPAINLRTAQS